jgi:hypothetical protein
MLNIRRVRTTTLSDSLTTSSTRQDIRFTTAILNPGSTFMPDHLLGHELEVLRPIGMFCLVTASLSLLHGAFRSRTSDVTICSLSFNLAGIRCMNTSNVGLFAKVYKKDEFFIGKGSYQGFKGGVKKRCGIIWSPGSIPCRP